MAQIINLSVVIVCISLLHYTVLSQPALSLGGGAGGALGGLGAAGGSSGGGGAGAGAGLGTAANAAAGAQAQAEGAVTAGTQLATEGTANVAEALKEGAEGAAALATSAGNGMLSMGAAKLATAGNLAKEGAAFGANLLNQGTSALGNAFGSGLSMEELQKQFGNALSLEQLQALIRTGMLNGIDFVDQGTGQFNAMIRPMAAGGAGLIDGGFNAIGFRQPVFVPLADAMWQAGETGRQNTMGFGRQMVNGGFALPTLLTSGSLGGLGGGSAAGSLGAGGSTRGSFEAQAGITA